MNRNASHCHWLKLVFGFEIKLLIFYLIKLCPTFLGFKILEMYGYILQIQLL